jgi:YrbI family 3-deoxy-D-manno-octulosonate 8-phosphate phosphatase
MKILAVIPARGGSKGIPRKNLEPVGGIPLVVRAVEAALGSKKINRVAVSTDDREIAEAASRAGAMIIQRPPEISGDKSSSESAILHALEVLRKRNNYAPDVVVFIQCTSPLLVSSDVDGTIKALLGEKADSAFSAAPFHHFIWNRTASGAEGVNHDKSRRPMRQEMKEQFIENGAVYAMRVKGFIKAKRRFFGRTAVYVMPPERSIEIDAPFDLYMAGAAHAYMHGRVCEELLPGRIAAVVTDFDGVLTDNRVLVSQDAKESVYCNRSDGLAANRLKKLGITLLILSSEKNPVVKARARKLDIPVIQGRLDKEKDLAAWLKKNRVRAADVVYVGNELNDLGCMKIAGCPVAVADAHPEAKARAKIVLNSAGGSGALRELVDMIESKLRRIRGRGVL